jgi:hypothetical protein
VNAEPRDRASAIFLGLAAIPPEDREAWLAAQCGTDAALRAAVDAILAAVDAPGDFLDPAALHPRALDADTPLAAGTRIGDVALKVLRCGAGAAGSPLTLIRTSVAARVAPAAAVARGTALQDSVRNSRSPHPAIRSRAHPGSTR